MMMTSRVPKPMYMVVLSAAELALTKMPRARSE